MEQRRATRKPLSVELINTRITERDYQLAAIRSMLEGIERKRRWFLLVMATGTGKTRTAVSLLDVLLRAKWAKRVLFLVDRIALQEQALDAFQEFLPAEPHWTQTEGGSIEREFVRKRRVYVTTYATMLNLIQKGKTPEAWISPYFFDAVIADESHRSIYNTYAQVLQYFHAIKLGLTATPTDYIEHNTFDLFDCSTNDPTFAYTFAEATAHAPPYLCDFEVLKVRSKFQLEGIHGGQLPPAVQRRLVTEGRDIEDIDFEGTDLERKVTNSGTNALIVREFMEEGIKDSSGTLPGKSIIFAISKGHARRLQALFDSMYPQHAGRLARVLVSEDRFVYGKGGLLDQFKTKDFPRVAISVDMLDTGVDVPEVVNLVFAKPVYSYVKFWQMIGRGTRVLDPNKLCPWCPEEDKFLIIDCWGNFDFFKMKPKGKEPGQQESLPVRRFRTRLDKLEAALATGRNDVAEAVKTDLRSDLQALPANDVVVRDSRAELVKLDPDSFWSHLTGEKLGFLRSIIAPVFRACSAADFKAMRFETNVIELGTALLSDNQDAVDGLREGLVEQVAELPLSVNVVAQERDLIEAVQQPHWWSTPTEEKLRQLVERLVSLMKYRQRRTDAMLTLDIPDLLAIKETIEFGPDHERLTSSVYREKVEAFVRSLVQENLVLQKVQAGGEVTDDEIGELARLLESQTLHVTEDLLRRVYDHRTAHFIQFIRHILGLERLESWTETINRAFDEFIAQHTTFASLQIRFLQTLRTFVLQTGKVEKRALIDAPFTRIHPLVVVHIVFGVDRARLRGRRHTRPGPDPSSVACRSTWL